MVVLHPMQRLTIETQGICIAILVGTEAIEVAEDGTNLQNLLICLEMLPAAIGMFFAFPYLEYKDAEGVSLSAQSLMSPVCILHSVCASVPCAICDCC